MLYNIESWCTFCVNCPKTVKVLLCKQFLNTFPATIRIIKSTFKYFEKLHCELESIKKTLCQSCVALTLTLLYKMFYPGLWPNRKVYFVPH